MRVTLSQKEHQVTIELTPEQAKALGLTQLNAGESVEASLTIQTPDLMNELEKLMDEQEGLYRRLSDA